MLKGQSVARTSLRKKTATDFWLRVATDYNGGLSPQEIASRYINPQTGKNYTMKHIYWVIKQLNIRLV